MCIGGKFVNQRGNKTIADPSLTIGADAAIVSLRQFMKFKFIFEASGGGNRQH